MKATKKELFYNDFASDWESKINDLETQKRIKVIFNNLLNKSSLNSKKLLEVGCGMGYFSAKAYELGANVTGVDIGDRLIKKSKKRVPKGKFQVATASDLPFDNNSFDIVICTEVLEHIDNQDKAINELIRVLAKKGKLVITTPNKIYKPLFDILGFLKIRPYKGNEKWYFTWELKRLLLSKKVSIVKEANFNFIYPVKFLDYFEKFSFLSNFMINQGYLITK